MKTCDELITIEFVYSEKATKFCEISTLLLSTVNAEKSKAEVSQNFVTFSEYMNFTKWSNIPENSKLFFVVDSVNSSHIEKIGSC